MFLPSGGFLPGVGFVGSGGGIAAISAGTQVASSGTVAFANSNGVSFGMNGAGVVTASVAGVTPEPSVSVFSQWANFETAYSVSAGRVSIQKVSLPMMISASSGVFLADIRGNSNSSGGITFSAAAYSLSGSTASRVASGFGAVTWSSGSDTADPTVYGGISGVRYRSFAFPATLTAGDYLVAVAVATTNDGSARLLGRFGVNIVGTLAGAETAYFLDGVSAATTGAFPVTIGALNTNYIRTGLSAGQQPGFILFGA